VCLAGDLGERLAGGVADDGDDEPVVEGDRDVDVDVAVPQDAGLVPRGVDLGWAVSAIAQARVSRSVTMILTSAPWCWLAWARNASSLLAAATTVR
jgi:hypothetical protein